MQDDKEELELKKDVFLEAAGKVALKLRGDIGILRCYRDADLPDRSIRKLEKGEGDLQITTICRLAHAHGMKCSEFIKLVEDELPEDFSFNSRI